MARGRVSGDRKLSKTTVTVLGGIESAAHCLGTTTKMVRRWMRLGLSADGAERVAYALRQLQLKRRQA